MGDKMSRKDEIAAKAIRKTTLKSLKEKKRSRLRTLKAEYEKQVQAIHIEYSEDPERLKAKYAADDLQKSEKKRIKAEKKVESAKKIIEIEKNTRRLTTGEEIASSIVQGIGVGIFIAVTAILDTLAIKRLEADPYREITIVFYSLFGAFMIFMYIFSLLQHALTNLVGKRVFNRLSHVSAFLIIGFAYSAYTITKIQGVAGWILFGCVWAISLIGILFYSISGTKHEKLNRVLYVIAGFSGIFVAKTLHDKLTTISFTMIILAAVFYLLGIVFYSMKKIKYMHFIGNILFLFGSIYLFFSLFYI